MDALNLAITIILVTASGALAPGPLFFATISHGTKSGVKSGLMFSIAHTIIEFSLIIVLALGLVTFGNEPTIKLIIGTVGGIVLLIFGTIQIRNSIKSNFGKTEKREIKTSNLLILGLLFTGLNPFFIVWWLTVGINLILLSLEFASLSGVIFMYICHVWMDYIWLISIAYFAKKGMNILGYKIYRIIMGLFGAVLIYYGLSFLFNIK
jgi:threonine/homoserine/homoserine lactone efflux protein